MRIIELTITLEDIDPAVTRSLQVPADIRLDRLHLTLQAAMGWTNSHLYMFEAGGTTWGLPDPDFGGDDLPANKTTLARVIEDTGASTITYLYDFGDSWEHKIRIGATGEPVPGALYPRLTDIAGRCPPEDVGGVPGYEAFLEAIGDPGHPEHADLRTWYGGEFDPNIPESDELRLDVLKLAKRWQPKKKPIN
ncbi:plasmid pRiA4b ORF-3 family protein [Ruegeria aquimaris]|uniref:Plasmid pRiA4b ORF-3 family protein n=1 Tax=Ruegeria aquimaris TaxID=2984333 RepID=A0ABT3AEI2_9RHOB|nr:plasmid pRiA4b ORF-3 family protein [Ruegeria sp. XHP0148]MCV2887093.1 plasmid pRiA4b ORF-3 family protein [Ruegeria sp. XHP0148]